MNKAYTLPQFLTLMKLDIWEWGHVQDVGWIKATPAIIEPALHNTDYCPAPGVQISLLQPAPCHIPGTFTLLLSIDNLATNTKKHYHIDLTCTKHEKWILSLMGHQLPQTRAYNIHLMTRSTPYERFYQAAHAIFGVPLPQPRHKR
ncbi:MAG: hypothetical protein JXR39_01250 [Marinilabiliaceae bacterium]|nr:hypothetical protein [Marinilabiliaceae bacterium]